MIGFEPQQKRARRKEQDAPLAQGFDMATARELNNQPDSVPAMMKPGEYVLPPDTVAAVGGPQALDGLVDETHTQGNTDAIVPKGFEPEFFFATGGLVDDKKKRRQYATLNSAQEQLRRDARNRPSDPFDSTIGASSGLQARALAAQEQGQTAAIDQARRKEDRKKALMAGAEPTFLETLAAPMGGPAAALQAQQNSPEEVPGTTSLAGDATMPAQDFAARGFGGGARVAGAGVAEAATNDIQKTVGPDGRVTYSGQNIGPGATINGAAPGGGYMEVPGGTGGGYGSPSGFNVPGLGTFHSAENARMAANLRDGFNINHGANGPSVVTAGTSPEEARMQRQREQMMSRLAEPLTGDPRRDMTAAQRRSITDMMNMESGERRDAARSAAGMEQERMRLDAGRERDAMLNSQQTARLEMDERRLAGDERARGFTEREAQRRESVLARYDSAKDDAERAAVARQHPEIFGRQDGGSLKDRFMLVNRGKDDMGNDLGQELVDLSRYNPDSQQQRAKPLPTSKKDLKKGEVYLVQGNPMTWDGDGFI